MEKSQTNLIFIFTKMCVCLQTAEAIAPPIFVCTFQTLIDDEYAYTKGGWNIHALLL